ncbi:hypothetical protein ISCGN_008602 [Ixodes scapularis]
MCFKTSNDDQDDIEDEDQLTGIMLSGLEAHNVNAELAEYASLDNDVSVCRDDSLEDIVQEVTPAKCSSESEDDDEERNDLVPTVTAIALSTSLSSGSFCLSWIGIIHDSGRNITCVELEKPYWGLPQLRPHWLSWQLCAMQTAFTISTECLGKHRSSHIRQSGKDAELYRLRRKDIVQRAI